MIEAVVTLRDAVMATLLAWGGVDDTQMAGGDAARTQAMTPAPIERTADKPTSSVKRLAC